LVALVSQTGEKLTEMLEGQGVSHKARHHFAADIRAVLGDVGDTALRDQLNKLADGLDESYPEPKQRKPGEEEEEKPKAKKEGEEPDELAQLEAELAGIDEAEKAVARKQKLANLGRQLKLLSGRVEGAAGRKLAAIADAIAEFVGGEEYPKPKAKRGEEDEYPKPKAKKQGEEEEGEPEPEDMTVYATHEDVSAGFEVLGSAIANLQQEVKKLAEGTKVDITEILRNTPRASLKSIAAKSVTKSQEAKLDGRSTLAKDGPEETEPVGEGLASGVPLIANLKALNRRYGQGRKS